MIFTTVMRSASHGKNFTIGLHVLIWSMLLAIPIFVFNTRSFEGLSHSFFIVTNIVHIGLFYLNAFLLYPKLLTKKWWWLYIISLAAVVYLTFMTKVFILQLNPDFQLTDINRRIIGAGPIPFLIA